MFDTLTAPTVTRFSFPSHIAPESITCDREYVVVVRSPSGIMSFIGPFRPRSMLSAYDKHDLIFRGNFSITGEFPSGKCGNVLIPKEGRSKVFGVEYVLYEWTEEIAEHMARIKAVRREDERGCAHIDLDEKY